MVSLLALANKTLAETPHADFGANVRANQEEGDQQQEPTIAVNPHDPKILLTAAKDWRSGEKQVWYYRSTDGGHTWSDGFVALPDAQPNQSDPVVAFDGNGIAYLCVLGYNEEDFSQGGLYVARSEDSGATWGTPVQVTANSHDVFNDKEWLTVDRSGTSTDGYLYVSWTRFTTVTPRYDRADIVLSRSTDGGRTWSDRVLVSGGGSEDNVQGSFPAVGPGGELYVIYYSEYRGQHISIASSSDGGQSFGEPVQVAAVVRPPSPLPNSKFRIFVLPFLAVNPVSGALAVTWNDYGRGNADVMLAVSSDGGATFSEPVRINGDSGAADQFFPALAYGPDGVMHLAWLDRRDDPDNLTYSTYYAQSFDDGKTMLNEARLADAQSDPSVGFEGTLIGDYIQVDAVAGKAWVAWIDTRAGDQNIQTVVISGTLAGGGTATLPGDPPPAPTPTPTLEPGESFADPAFERVWQRADLPVREARAARPWLWGPEPFAAGREEYLQGVNGNRLVQYFDKARMEINDPTADPAQRWFVTNGLLVVELMSGRVQLGDDQFDTARHAPLDLPLAGDRDSPNAPTYASMARVASLQGDNSAPERTGQPVTDGLTRDGLVLADAMSPDGAPRIAYYERVLGHNVPDVFWGFMNQQGTVYEAGSYREGEVIDWLADFGYPITEPYWTKILVGGEERDALVQAFQRRVLTYVPANDPQWQVEMANVGRHYYEWRYGRP